MFVCDRDLILLILEFTMLLKEVWRTCVLSVVMTHEGQDLRGEPQLGKNLDPNTPCMEGLQTFTP